MWKGGRPNRVMQRHSIYSVKMSKMVEGERSFWDESGIVAVHKLIRRRRLDQEGSLRKPQGSAVAQMLVNTMK